MSATYLIKAVLGVPAMTRYRIVAGRANTARLRLGNPIDTVAESAQLDPAAARRFITRGERAGMSARPRVPQVWIIWYAVLLHIGWGCLLLVSPSPYGATALHIYHDLPRILMAGVLFLASGLAAWAVTRRQPSLRSLSALLPQQVLLTLSAYAAIAAVIAGHYGDGLPRPRLFILADQAPAILALILHTVAVIEIHARTPDSEVLRITFEAIGAEQERFRQTLPERGSVPDERRPDRIFSRTEKTDELLAEIRPWPSAPLPQPCSAAAPTPGHLSRPRG